MRLPPKTAPVSRNVLPRTAPVTAPTARSRNTVELTRAPEEAVSFIAAFQARLDLPPARLREYVLVEAAKPKDPPVLLELKELLAPSIENPPVPANGTSVVDAQDQLGGFTNPLTGATQLGGRAFLVREVEPEKANLSHSALNEKKELASAFEQAGRVLARAHGATPQQVAELQTWVGNDSKAATRQLTAFAQAYATQTQADWQAFRAASDQ